MRLTELLPAVPGALVVGPAEAEIAGVEHDSRRVTPGSLFVCSGDPAGTPRLYRRRRGTRAAAVVVQEDPAGWLFPGV